MGVFLHAFPRGKKKRNWLTKRGSMPSCRARGLAPRRGRHPPPKKKAEDLGASSFFQSSQPGLEQCHFCVKLFYRLHVDDENVVVIEIEYVSGICGLTV